MNILSKLQAYMTGRKTLLPVSLFASIISTILGFLPFILIWLIAKEFLAQKSDSSNINSFAWLAFASAVASIVLYFFALTLSHLAAFRAEVNIRKETMKKIIKMPLGFFDNNTSGRIRKIIDDNASITHSFLAHQLPDLAGTILMPIIAIGLIFFFDWRMGLTTLFPIIAAVMVMSFMMGKKGKYFMTQYMNSLEEMNNEAVEYVRGIPIVKVFQQTIYSFKNFHKSITNYRDMVVKYTNMWENPMSIYTVIINGFAFFLVPVSILLFTNTGSLGTVLLDLFFFLLITPIFAQSIMRSMYLNQAFGLATQAIDRIENLTSAQSLNVNTNPQQIKNYEIKFSNVSFTYPGANNKALNKICFTIPEGKTIALVGPSGSGKTTIARLVPRFWDVDEGQVTIGGINVKDIDSKSLMDKISFVFQNTKLFKTSLLENIMFGNPKATMEEVQNVVNLSQSREIIDKLPDGLDTIIGSKGTYLSGGEQQRIVLARAMLKNAPIVVLDEATAFADPENEHLIKQALDKLTEGKTVLMIAHRLSSVKHVDNILVIKNSQIAEQGSHNKLIDSNGLYSFMWNEYQQAAHWTIGKEVEIA